MKRLRKKAVCGVALHPESLRRTLKSTPHAPGFTRLASDPFCEAVDRLKIYEMKRFRKKAVCGVALRPESLRRTLKSTPHAPGFARLASDPFCEAVDRLKIYEMKRLRKKAVCGVALRPESLRRTLKSTPHAPGFARLASDPFCEAVDRLKIYEMKRFRKKAVCGVALRPESLRRKV